MISGSSMLRKYISFYDLRIGSILSKHVGPCIIPDNMLSKNTGSLNLAIYVLTIHDTEIIPGNIRSKDRGFWGSVQTTDRGFRNHTSQHAFSRTKSQIPKSYHMLIVWCCNSSKSDFTHVSVSNIFIPMNMFLDTEMCVCSGLQVVISPISHFAAWTCIFTWEIFISRRE